MNVRMEAMYVKESMNIQWVAETGMLDAIAQVVKEFKETRKLLVTTLLRDYFKT